MFMTRIYIMTLCMRLDSIDERNVMIFVYSTYFCGVYY